METTGVVGVGFSCADVYPQLDKFYPTGNGVDFCVHLSRLGLSTAIVSAVGTDHYGRLMITALQKEGIDVSHLKVTPGDTCLMLMEMRGNDRVHGEELPGVMSDFALDDADLAFIETYDYLHTDLFGRVLQHLPRFKRSGLRIVMDFSVFFDDPEYRARENLPFVDYAFCSYRQRDAYIEQFMQEAQALGPRIVIATLGENGSLAYDGERFYEYGILPAKVVNTVGAGDAYIAGFMYGVIRGEGIPQCMARGAQEARDVIEKFEPY